MLASISDYFQVTLTMKEARDKLAQITATKSGNIAAFRSKFKEAVLEVQRAYKANNENFSIITQKEFLYDACTKAQQKALQTEKLVNIHNNKMFSDVDDLDTWWEIIKRTGMNLLAVKPGNNNSGNRGNNNNTRSNLAAPALHFPDNTQASGQYTHMIDPSLIPPSFPQQRSQSAESTTSEQLDPVAVHNAIVAAITRAKQPQAMQYSQNTAPPQFPQFPQQTSNNSMSANKPTHCFACGQEYHQMSACLNCWRCAEHNHIWLKQRGGNWSWSKATPNRAANFPLNQVIPHDNAPPRDQSGNTMNNPA
jgi:hypothetical protein